MAKCIQRVGVYGCILARIPQDRSDEGDQDIPTKNPKIRQVRLG
jgi:hypothetical protein